MAYSGIWNSVLCFVSSGCTDREACAYAKEHWPRFILHRLKNADVKRAHEAAAKIRDWVVKDRAANRR
jgi:hypothetical protein